jgi:2-succinyl-5-enolpyruvyl-6-hydroxy-3-cyclohexene-1-carboxylate synthase
MAQHGGKEHDEIEDVIEDLKKMKTTNKAWEHKVEKLKELVEHHVKDEEGKMFKEVKKVLTVEDALIIKEQMHYLK